jgi:hypothetical protein
MHLQRLVISTKFLHFLWDRKALQEQRVSQVKMDLLASTVKTVEMELMARQVLQVPLVHKVLQVQQVPLLL